MSYSWAVREEILKVLSAIGQLTKEEILDAWGLSEPEYKQLQDSLLQTAAVSVGPKGSGGFRVRTRLRPSAAADTVDEWDDWSLPAWERSAASRLAELLSYSELEELLSGLLYTVRQSRKTRTGEDRRGTKQELAGALLVQHGADLFATCKKARKAVALRLGLTAPKRWCSGKGGALAFVTAAQFPKEMAGLPSDDAKPDFEYIEPRPELCPLADFQMEVSNKLLDLLRAPRSRGIVTLPTGAGKTRVAVDTIRDWMARHRSPSGHACVIWLAHTEELCEQAYASFKQVWEASPSAPPLWLFRFWGQYTKDVRSYQGQLDNVLTEPTVLISTPHRLRNFLVGASTPAECALLSNLHRTIRAIVIDEAHRAAAPIYSEILDQFSADASNACVIGLTATPFRQEYRDDPEGGTVELTAIFEQILEPTDTLGPDPRATLIARRVLATPKPITIPTRTVLSAPQPEQLNAPTDEELERIDRALKLKADNPARRSLVFEYLLPIAQRPDTRTLYFGPSVADAECMAFLLRERGVRAAALSARTRDVTRRRLVQEFRDGTFNVLCNCEVLTTGFDAPKVTHIVMARPTVSQVLYEQMVGRGLRGPEFGGTEQCYILDCEDNYKQGRPVLGYLAFRHLWLDANKPFRKSA